MRLSSVVREEKSLGGVDTVGVATGAEIMQRAMAKLSEEIAPVMASQYSAGAGTRTHAHTHTQASQYSAGAGLLSPVHGGGGTEAAPGSPIALDDPRIAPLQVTPVH